MKVYLAGKVTKPDGTYDDWRDEIVGHIIPLEQYAGPRVSLYGNRPWSSDPGPCTSHAEDAEHGIRECDILIAVVDTLDCYNTLVEIGYAAALNKMTAAWVPTGKLEISTIAELRSVLHWANVCDRGFYDLPEFISICLAIESPIEWLMFGALTDFPLRLTPQFSIGKYRVDFLVNDTNICVEIDGHEYHKTKEQRTRDAKREREIERLGYQVIRFTGSEVFRDKDGCAWDVYEAYQQYKLKHDAK